MTLDEVQKLKPGRYLVHWKKSRSLVSTVFQIGGDFQWPAPGEFVVLATGDDARQYFRDAEKATPIPRPKHERNSKT